MAKKAKKRPDKGKPWKSRGVEVTVTVNTGAGGKAKRRFRV